MKSSSTGPRTTEQNAGVKETLCDVLPNPNRYLQTDKVADDDDDDEYDSDDDEQLDGTAPAVRSERPFDYVCNREAKQGLLFRNAQMVNP